MKRTLLEALAALAVVVVMASYHHQITRLQDQQADVATLRQIVRDAVEQVRGRDDVAKADKLALERLVGKVNELEAEVAEASARGKETRALRQELEAARREASLFQSKIARDVVQTRELVDAFHREVQSVDRYAKETIGQTRTNLEDLAARITPDPTRLDQQLLLPTVQLNGDDTVGSGTLVYSRHNPKVGKVESYVLTSYHVVRNILADTPSARRTGIAVTIYGPSGKREARGDMVSHDERIDAAMLLLHGEERYEWVAKPVSRTRAHNVRVWEQIYAVGCPLGNDPIPSRG
jgi:S1-C subfamily serine protease